MRSGAAAQRHIGPHKGGTAHHARPRRVRPARLQMPDDFVGTVRDGDLNFIASTPTTGLLRPRSSSSRS